MRFIKMLSLAAFAALAVFAFVASSASADTFCETSGLHTGECPEGKRVAEGEHLTGLAVKPQLLNSAGKVLEECEKSEALGKVGANLGKHTGVKFEIEKLTWTNCKGECSKVTSATGFPYAGVALALALAVDINSSGTTVLSGCSFLNLECTYRLPGGKGTLGIESDLLVANKVSLERSTPCNFESAFPNPGLWDGKYLIELDGNTTPVFIAALP